MSTKAEAQSFFAVCIDDLPGQINLTFAIVAGQVERR
jgi:hypothetical protein